MKTLLSFIYAFLFSLSIVSQELDTTLLRLKKNIESSTNKYLKVKALIKIGEYQMKKKSHSAEEYFLDAQDIIESFSYKQKEKQEAKLNSLMGILHKRSGNFLLALDYYYNSLLYYRSVSDTLSLSKTYHQIADSYRSSKVNDSAIANYKKSIKLKKKLGNLSELAVSYHKIGISYSKLPTKIDSANLYYIKAKELYTFINNKDKIHEVNNYIARFFFKKKRYKEAKYLLLENLKHYRNTENKYRECVTEYYMSLMYKKDILSNSSKEYDKGLIHAENSLMIAQEEKFEKYAAKIYKLKTFFYVKKGDYKEAFESYKKYDVQNLKIFNESEIKKFQALELHYKFREERKELELQADKERSLRILYVTLFIITLSGSLLIGFFARKNFLNKVKITSQKLEKEKIQKKLLKEQIKASEAEIKFLISDNKMKLLSKKELLLQLKQEESLTASEHIKKFVRSLIYKIKQQVITEDKLLTIQDKINEVDKGFDRKIRKLYPNLTKNEREVCILLRLNLSIKEIVSIKNTTIDSIKSIRYRIRKKIGLSPGQELEKKIQDL